MQVSSDVFAQPPPAVLPPPSARSTPGCERRLFGADAASLKMSYSSSSNSLNSLRGASSSAMPGPSFGATVVTSKKGSKYDISGPSNFQHVSGDVTRDRTRNAFDLNTAHNDNVLKKYMMEHGITEEDVAGIPHQELVKNIVHSNFTWQPKKKTLAKQKAAPAPLQYATISTNNQITPPPSPPPTIRQPAAAPVPNTAFSNYATLTSRFVDISDMEIPSMAPPNHRQPEVVGTVVPVQVQSNRSKVPPPPSTVTAANTRPQQPPQQLTVEVLPSVPKASTENYATIGQTTRKVGTMRVPPPAPPKPSIVPTANAPTVQYAPVKQAPPPPPVKPAPAPVRNEPQYVPVGVRSESQLAQVPIRSEPMCDPVGTRSESQTIPVRSGPPPFAAELVQSRFGGPSTRPPTVAQLPVQQPKPTASIPPPAPPQPAVKTGAAGSPPPPPPPPAVAASVVPMPPPPPPAFGGGAPMPPPPPPPAGGALKQSEAPKAAPAAAGGDDRDAFLQSIRQGVKLKKVDQKSATISGVKPRAEKKPATTDFLSELKLGITLRRVKNPADNPYSQANATDESQA